MIPECLEESVEEARQLLSRWPDWESRFGGSGEPKHTQVKAVPERTHKPTWGRNAKASIGLVPRRDKSD